MKLISKIALTALIIPSIINSVSMEETKEKYEPEYIQEKRINNHSKVCLKEHLPKALVDLTMEYITKWTCEQTIKGDERYDCRICELEKNKLAIARKNIVEIWDLESNKLIHILKGHPNNVFGLSVQQNKLISICSFEIRIWDITTKKNIAIIPAKSSGKSLCLLLNNKLVYASYNDKDIHIWDLATNKYERSLTGHDRNIRWLLLLPKNRFASASLDKTIKIWDMDSFKLVVNCSNNNSSNLSGFSLLSNNRFVSENIKIWDMNTLKVQALCNPDEENSQTIVCALPNNMLASYFHKKFEDPHEIKIWNLGSGECIKTLIGETKSINQLIYLPKNKLASVTFHIVRIWDLNSDNCEVIEYKTEYPKSIEDVCLLSNNKLAIAYTDGITQIWSNEAITEYKDKEFEKFKQEKESWVTE